MSTPVPTPSRVRRSRVSPAHTEPVARGFLGFLGGPVGYFAAVGRQRWWTPLRTLIFTALIFLSFGYLSKANCLGTAVAEDGTVSLDWSGNRQYSSACYNDIAPLLREHVLPEAIARISVRD